jgi:hypothetical protein
MWIKTSARTQTGIDSGFGPWRRARAASVARSVVLSVVVCGPALSDVSDAQREEVVHLLELLRNTTCTVERNGKRHNGENAYLHVQKKYDYFRDNIKTTEEFIEYSATKSTMSGKYYMVICEERSPMRTQDWLLQELDTYRKKHKG